MASLNGISVKALKTFRGHEGEPLYQGNLYLNNKKIGFWSQDGWGGPDHVVLDQGYSEILLNEAVHALNADKDYRRKAECDGREFVLEYNVERLMGDLMVLCEDEKIFKGALKKGYEGIVVASDGYTQVAWSLGRSYMVKDDDAILKALSDDIDNAKKSFMKENKYVKHTLKIYRSLDDFVVGEPIKLEDVVRKPKLKDAIDSCEKLNNKDSVDKRNNDVFER